MKEKIGHPHKKSFWGAVFFGIHDPNIQNTFRMIERMETNSASGKAQLQADKNLSKKNKSNQSAKAKLVPLQPQMDFSEVSFFLIFMSIQMNNTFIIYLNMFASDEQCRNEN